MPRVYLSSFSSSWQTNAPHIPASLHCYVEQFPEIRDNFSFPKYFFHTKNGVRAEVEKLESPDIIAGNIVGWNKNRTLKFLRLAKQIYPRAVVVLGGNNVPLDPDPYFFQRHPYIDILVHKEGERPFEQILRSYLENDGFSVDAMAEVNGVSYNCKGELKKGLPISLIGVGTLMDYPSPFLTGKFESYFDEIDQFNEFRGGVWETNRGCPYTCTFCDWGQLTASRLRRFPDERVFPEIDYFVEHFDEIFFADSNFGILSRDVELAHHLANSYFKNKNRRLKTVHIGGAKNANRRLLEIGKAIMPTQLFRSGMSISLQTYTDSALKAVKRQNIKKENFIELQKEYREQGVSTYTDLIINCPTETIESFYETLNIVFSQDVSDVRMFAMEMFPNSEISKQVDEFGIKTKKLKIYSGHEPDEDEFVNQVYATSSMDWEETMRLRRMCRFLDYAHQGKWTYYISWYLYREHDVKFMDFYHKIFHTFSSREESIIYKVLKGRFLREYNAEDGSTYSGAESPFNIEWRDSYFRQEQFNWTCIAFHRQQFYAEVCEFLLDKFPEVNRDIIQDLVRFNNQIIFSIEYDPAVGAKHNYSFDWHSFFLSRLPLKKIDIEIHYTDQYIGRSTERRKIIKGDPEFMRWASGARSFFTQRQGSYTHDLKLAEKHLLSQPQNACQDIARENALGSESAI